MDIGILGDPAVAKSSEMTAPTEYKRESAAVRALMMPRCCSALRKFAYAKVKIAPPTIINTSITMRLIIRTLPRLRLTLKIPPSQTECFLPVPLPQETHGRTSATRNVPVSSRQRTHNPKAFPPGITFSALCGLIRNELPTDIIRYFICKSRGKK